MLTGGIGMEWQSGVDPLFDRNDDDRVPRRVFVAFCCFVLSLSPVSLQFSPRIDQRLVEILRKTAPFRLILRFPSPFSRAIVPTWFVVFLRVQRLRLG